MKCIIISDSHGSYENIERAVKKNPDADVVFFLGDGIYAVEKYAAEFKNMAWLYVLGNCDKLTAINGEFVKKVDRINLCGRKIVLTHGDLYGVKGGTGGLIDLAAEEGADIVLYGHTHAPKEEYISERGIWLFNPGSLERSIGSEREMFGLLVLSDAGDVLFSHGHL